MRIDAVVQTHQTQLVRTAYSRPGESVAATLETNDLSPPPHGEDNVSISNIARQLAHQAKPPEPTTIAKESTASQKRLLETPGGMQFVMATGRPVKTSAEKLVDELV